MATTIPSRPAPSDTTATKSSPDASKQGQFSLVLVINMQANILHPPDRQPSSAITDAARAAIEHTNSWTPCLDRRQSWSTQDQKHALHMSACKGVRAGQHGFTERPEA